MWFVIITDQGWIFVKSFVTTPKTARCHTQNRHATSRAGVLDTAPCVSFTGSLGGPAVLSLPLESQRTTLRVVQPQCSVTTPQSAQLAPSCYFASFYCDVWRVRFTFAENLRRQNRRLAEPSSTVGCIPGDIRIGVTTRQHKCHRHTAQEAPPATDSPCNEFPLQRNPQLAT